MLLLKSDCFSEFHIKVKVIFLQLKYLLYKLLRLISADTFKIILIKHKKLINVHKLVYQICILFIFFQIEEEH